MIHTPINLNYKHEIKVTSYHNKLHCKPSAIKALLLYHEDALCEFTNIQNNSKNHATN